MTKEDVKDSLIKITNPYHDLNYFYFDRHLTVFEINAMSEIFPECDFSNRVSQSNNIFLKEKGAKYVKWLLPSNILEKYIARQYSKLVNAYDNS